ncbi:MAG: GAF domain-containing protein, partial [Anaerolineales bacterium]
MATKRSVTPKSDVASLKKELAAREKEHKKSLRVQSALYKIADAASASKNLETFYKTVHKIVGKLMYAENFFIAFHDKTTDIISFPYYVDSSKGTPPMPHPLNQSGGGTRIVLKAMQPVHVTRSDVDKLIAEGEMELREPLAEDLMGVPFIVDKNLDGVIVIQNYRKEIAYTDTDLEVLVFVAQHIAT